MLPPFVAVDLRIDRSPLPIEERRVVRRSAPERLRFDAPPLLPAVLIAPAPPPPLPRPAGEGGGWARRLAGLLRLAAPA